MNPTSSPRVTRREMLRLSATAAALLALRRTGYPAAEPAVPPAPHLNLGHRRPNILMLVADDHRHSAIGSLGEPLVQTPVLDRLAASGTAFTQVHDMSGCHPAVCVPARAALHTGCTVFKALADLHKNVIAPGRVTIGEWLAREGYRTHGVGKWHNDTASFNRSFQSGAGIFFGGMGDQRKVLVHPYDSTGAYPASQAYIAPKFSTDFFCDTTIDFLAQQKGKTEPFFLYTAFTAPHDPRTPPKEFADLYDPRNIPVPPNFLPDHPFDNGELVVRDELLAPQPRTPERMSREIADYYGMVSSLDAGVGRILAALEASGQADNTLVLYTADHGLALGQHGLLGKQNLYDHSIRVPFILRGPGIAGGRRSDALLYTWDAVPTLCELAGLPVAPDLDARSFRPLLTGEQKTHRKELHALYRDFQRMAKDDRMKLIEYHVAGDRHTQLFDLAADPWEKHNLAAETAHRPTLDRLRSSLAQWQSATGDRWALPS